MHHGGDLAARGTNDEQVIYHSEAFDLEAFDLGELCFEYTLVFFFSRQAGEVVA